MVSPAIFSGEIIDLMEKLKSIADLARGVEGIIYLQRARRIMLPKGRLHFLPCPFAW